jgi:hypothetical protein
MSKALMAALLLTGLPVVSYAEDTGVVGAAGTIARAPLDAAAGIVGGLTGAEGPRFHHYVVEQMCHPTLGRIIRTSWLGTFCRLKASSFVRYRLTTM